MQERSIIGKAYDTACVILFFLVYWNIAGYIVTKLYGKIPKKLTEKYIYARQKLATQIVTFFYLLVISLCILLYVYTIFPVDHPEMTVLMEKIIDYFIVRPELVLLIMIGVPTLAITILLLFIL